MEITSNSNPNPNISYFPDLCSRSAVNLTVWCKSLLFNGKGYTVYDNYDGRIIFRVDNYTHDKWRNDEMALMGSTGHVLLTIRRCRKILSLAESWKIYKGDTNTNSGMLREQEPLLRVTKDSHNCSCTVSTSSVNRVSGGDQNYSFKLSWSRSRHERWAIIQRSSDESLVAQVSRKFSNSKKTMLDEDVLTLTVEPGMDQAIVMALIMITNTLR